MNPTSTATITLNGTQDKSKPNPYCDLTPHPDAQGVEVFDDIINDLHRYLNIGEEEAVTATFWAAHANIFTTFEYTPILVITAPMRNCGKTTLLSVLNRMTNHSLHGDNMTPSAYFRLANKGDTSFFFDEADNWFGKKRNSDKESEMTAALNGGRTEDGVFWRSNGDGKGGFEPTTFGTWCAVALAGIQLERRLPNTTLDRSIVIHMHRAMPGQLAERFRRRKHLPLFRKHGERLLRWCNDNRQRLRSHDPNIPDEVDGRYEEVWNSLISVAQVASPEWGRKLQNILLNQTQIDPDDAFVNFLRDYRRIIDSEFSSYRVIKPADAAVALGALPAIDDPTYRPWARFHVGAYHEQDARIKSVDVTKFLQDAQVYKKTIRTLGDANSEDTVHGHMVSEILSAQQTYAPMPEEYDSGYEPGEDREEGNGSWIRDHNLHSEEESHDAIPF